MMEKNIKFLPFLRIKVKMKINNKKADQDSLVKIILWIIFLLIAAFVVYYLTSFLTGR